MSIPFSFHSIVLVFLIATAFFLVLLLIPLPKFAQKIVISLLAKINAKFLIWPKRFFLACLVCAVIYSYVDMSKYEDIAMHEDPKAMDYGRIHQETMLKKFRAERNFYLNLFALVLVVITWRIQNLIYQQHSLEDEKRVLEMNTSKDKKNK